MNLSTACKKFMDHCAVERQLSQNTLLGYRSDLADFGRWLPSPQAVKAITTETLRGYLESMVRQRKLAASTVRRRLMSLRSFFRYLNDSGEAADPFTGWRLKLPRPLHLPRTLSRDETTSLLDAARRDTAGTSLRVSAHGTEVCLMISTGIRVGELCKIQVGDVSHDASRLRIHGKGSRDRIVYVTNPDLRADLRILASFRKKAFGNSGPLFVNRNGRRMQRDSFALQLRRFAWIAGLQRRVTPHMLRHTAATLLIESAVDIRIVQRMLGHSSIATTEIYTHVSDETLRSTLERANVLGALTKGSPHNSMYCSEPNLTVAALELSDGSIGVEAKAEA
jgi:integrase/recombinase XerD